jgi:hypothetical protein
MMIMMMIMMKVKLQEPLAVSGSVEICCSGRIHAISGQINLGDTGRGRDSMVWKRRSRGDTSGIAGDF